MTQTKKQRFKTESEVLDWLQRKIDRPLDADIVECLKKEDLLSPVLEAYSVEDFDESLYMLYKGYRRYENLIKKKLGSLSVSTSSTKETVEPIHETTHDVSGYYGKLQASLSDVLANYAANDEMVIHFRNKYLNGTLLTPEELKEWLQKNADDSVIEAEDALKKDWPAEAKEQGLFIFDDLPDDQRRAKILAHRRLSAAEKHVTFTVDDSPAQQRAKILRRKILQGIEALYFDRLDCHVPGEAWKNALHIGKVGAMGYLKAIAASLAKRYHWQEYQAVFFILTGTPPLFHVLRTTYSLSSTAPLQITLNIFGHLPAEEVIKAYKKVLHRIRGKEGTIRDNPLTPKTLALAVFASGLTTGTWEENMFKWNKQYPDSLEYKEWKKLCPHSPDSWDYKDRRTFCRDCKSAVRRVIRPGFVYF